MTVAQQTEDDFEEIFGRGGDALLEPYRCDDAEYIVVGLGSLTYQLRDVVETLRGEGLKLGVLGVRLYRPFPDEALAAALRHARGVFVIEKALSYGYEGALCSDVKAALYEPHPGQEPGPLRQGHDRRHRGPRDPDRRPHRHPARRHRRHAPRGPDWIGIKL